MSDARANTWSGPTRSRISVPGAATNTMRRVRGETGSLLLRAEPDWRYFLFICLPRIDSSPYSSPRSRRRGGEIRWDLITHHRSLRVRGCESIGSRIESFFVVIGAEIVSGAFVN